MTRRTTIVAEEEDLQTLQEEARRLGRSMAQLLKSVIAAKAAELRAKRKPRFGLGRSESGTSQASVDDELSPAKTPYSD